MKTLNMGIKNVIKLVAVSWLLLGVSCCAKKETENPPPPPPEPADSVYYRGMDLSFQPEIEVWQTKYYDAEGQEVALLPYLKDHGVNLVRLRLWHTPDTTFNGLESVVEYAKQVKAHDMDILLDFHYSDTWADPGHQYLPAAWQGLTIDQLNDSIYVYTRRVMNRFKAEGVLPAMVQVGNETNGGFLWNQGRVGGEFNNNWSNYIRLVKSAIYGIREIGDEEEVKVMLHFAGVNGATWYFDNLTQYLVDYDVIGLSFYSIWHGTNYATWESKFFEIANRYSKEIMVVETGYPWTFDWNDWTNNNYGQEDQLFPDIPATPEGQKEFMKRLNSSIVALGKKGIGYCYWAPDWVAYKGNVAENGSTWENVAVFDFENKALPVMEVFSGESK